MTKTDKKSAFIQAYLERIIAEQEAAADPDPWIDESFTAEEEDAIDNPEPMMPWVIGT